MEWKPVDLNNALLVSQALNIVESNAPYFALTGDTPSLTSIQNMVQILPPNTTKEQKHFFLILENESPLALLDYVCDHPKPGCVYIGLLMLDGEQQSKGFAPIILKQLGKKLSPQYTNIRLGVLENNPRALAFWKREGFVESKKIQSQLSGASSWVHVLEKSL